MDVQYALCYVYISYITTCIVYIYVIHIVMYEDTYGCIRTEIIHQLLPKALFDPNSIVGVSTGPLVGIGQAFEVMFFLAKK